MHIDFFAPAPVDFQEDLMRARGYLEGAVIPRAQLTDDRSVDDNLVRAKVIDKPVEIPLHFDKGCFCRQVLNPGVG